MKLLLTSAGVSNASIRDALVELLGKPVEDSTALVVPTAILPFSSGPELAARLVRGEVPTLTGLGWRSLGLLELTALPSISPDVWTPTVQAADALLFWGGDPLYLSHWIAESGLGHLLPSLRSTVYVGTSAGAMAACSTFGETYLEPRSASGRPLTSEEVVFATPDGDVSRTFVTAAGAGLVDCALIPHLDNPRHPDASLANAEQWAARLPVATYAVDDSTALKVVDDVVEVVSEGTWRLFADA